MRKNIRRSLMVAAAASGIWALSTAGASAAALPMPSGAGSAVGGTVEKAGEDGKGTVADTVRRATDTVKETTGTVENVTGEVREELPSKGIPENGLPTNTLPTNTLPTGGLPAGAADGVTGKLRGTDATGSVEGAKGAGGQVFDRTGHASKAIKEARKDVRSTTDGLPVAPGVPAVQALPGVPTGPVVPSASGVPALPTVPALPAVPAAPTAPPVPAVPTPGVPSVPSAPSAGELAGALPAAPLRPEQLTALLKGRHAEETVSNVRNTVATAHPVIDNVTGNVPAVRPVALHGRATGYQFAADAAKTVDCALSTTAPLAESTYYRTQALTQDPSGDLGTFAQAVAADSAVYAYELAGTGVHGNVDELAAHTVTNVGSLVTSPTERDLTDPANIPGLPVASQVPAGL